MAISSILEAIGNTPVIRLNNVVPQGAAEIFGKYEAGNPSLSIKDRIALAMVEEALATGKITPTTTLVDATAGNTGVALAMVCAVKKIKLLLFMPSDASLERRKMFEGFGAQVVLTPPEKGMTAAVAMADEYVQAHAGSCRLNQFDNPANPKAHKETTAQEVLRDFPGGVDALVLGVGTGGSLTGVGEVLKGKFPSLKIVAVEPAASPVLSGGDAGKHRIQQLGLGFIPGNLDRSLIDEVVHVTDSEAYLMTRRLSHKEGMLLGISSGANVHAAVKVAEELGPGKKVLTFLCDAGQRYFSLEQFFKNP